LNQIDAGDSHSYADTHEGKFDRKNEGDGQDRRENFVQHSRPEVEKAFQAAVQSGKYDQDLLQGLAKGDSGLEKILHGKEGIALGEPEVQSYLASANVPEEKRQQAEAAFQQASEASTSPYERGEISDSGRVDRDELRQAREAQAAAYRGLLRGDAEVVKSAIENAPPVFPL
jgi:hypothetical protein